MFLKTTAFDLWKDVNVGNSPVKNFRVVKNWLKSFYFHFEHYKYRNLEFKRYKRYLNKKMKLSLIILVTTIMAEIAKNSNLRTPKPLHMVLDDLLQFDSSSSGPFGLGLR